MVRPATRITAPKFKMGRHVKTSSNTSCYKQSGYIHSIYIYSLSAMNVVQMTFIDFSHTFPTSRFYPACFCSSYLLVVFITGGNDKNLKWVLLIRIAFSLFQWHVMMKVIM